MGYYIHDYITDTINYVPTAHLGPAPRYRLIQDELDALDHNIEYVGSVNDLVALEDQDRIIRGE